MGKNNIEDIYTLSPLQKGLLFHSLSSAESDAYLQQLRLSIRGRLDLRAFERAWRQVIARHTILRTAFVWDRHEKLLQVVRKQVKLPWVELDWRALPAEEQQEQLAALLREDRRRGFDLSKAPLLRMTVARLADESYELFCTLHHLLTDGWSTATIIKELFAFYNASCEGREPVLERPRPYRDYIEWLGRQDMVEAELFWRELLKGFTAPTPLVGGAEPSVWSETSESIELQRAWLSPATTEQLQATARRLGITLNTLVLGAWAVLLGRYGDEQDVIFGVTVSGRPASLPGVEAMVGLFINTLPMRVRLPPEARLQPWLEELQAQLLEIREYEYSPLTEVQGFSDVPRGVPLFESMLVFENYPLEDATRGLSRHLESVNIHSLERSSFPLGLVAAPGPKLYLQVGYDSRRFNFDTMCRLLGHLEAVLESMAADPAQRLGDLSLLTPAERQQLLVAWNETEAEAPPDGCLHQLCEEQVARSPEAVAVVFEDECLTYRELNKRANQLAHYLRDRHVGPDAHVGICVERSLEMIVGILGILKAGAAYVPIDPHHPPERLSYILEDARVGLLLTQQSVLDRLPGRAAQAVCLDADWAAVARHGEENPPPNVTGYNTAYVIYTSGSTGRPKGVLNPHAGVCGTLRWRRQAFSLGEADHILQNLSFAFDASVWQIFGALLNGGQLILARPEHHRDTAYLTETMIEHGVTITDFPPPMLQALLNEPGIERCVSLRHLFCGGEAMSPELQEQFFAKLGSELHNVYGPTETAIDAACWTCRREESRQVIPMGRPIRNKQIYLLDSQLRPVPVGVEGEICIGGSGLARGYLNRPAATAEKFIPHPYSAEPGARLYKTGDIARFLPDGNIEFVGRRDQQVKVRGFRIELGEVEAALAQHPRVGQAVAMARELAQGEKRLVAYVVSRHGAVLTSGELRSYLQERLPSYMIPSAFVRMEALPLTNNGKVDRRALPAQFDLEKSDYVAPRTAVEEILCGVWAKVLRVEQAGVYDNFFELGGDSILSIQVSAQAREAGLHLTPRHLFEHQTVANLAEVATRGKHVRAEQGLVTGAAPLTPIQHEFFEWELTDHHHYYQAVLLKLAPEIDSRLLGQALDELLTQHDALRLRFTPEENGWKQAHAGPVTESVFTRKDLSRLGVSEQAAALEEDAGLVQRSLNLEHGPLFRAVEYDLGAEQGRRLLLLIHHLAVDGVSWRVLLDDLQRGYEQLLRSGRARLPAKTTSFKAWAERLSEYARGAGLRQEAPYWLSRERELVGRLPVDYRLGDNSTGSARTLSVTLSADETRALLQEVPAVYHTQINDLLLTALAQTFERWSGQRALLVTLEGHGREEIFEDVDLSRTVGWFTTVFPVLLQLEEGLPPGRALREIKEQLRQIPQRGLGYGLLRFLSGDEGLAARLKALPPAEVSFNYLGQFDQVFSGSELFAAAEESADWSQDSEGRRKHQLDVAGMVFNGCLRLSWTYSENLHRRETIERLAGWYLESLRELIAHCESPGAGGFTPSDFPLAGLDQRTLDERIGPKERAVDIYPLSPMQEGLLFHSLYARDSKAYFLQASCRIAAALDVTAFLRAWQTVVERHAILRTSFLWEGLPRPLQVVHAGVSLDWTEEDWQELSPEEQAANWEDFLRRDRDRPFDLTEKPLMRLALRRTGPESYYFSWSTHHILLDGWSNQFVLNEMFALYEAYTRDGELQLKQPPQYREYIAWLQRQDLRRAESFWREELRGFTEPTTLGMDRGAGAAGEEEEYEEQAVSLPEEVTGRLESLARALKITLNTVMQGAWGLLLGRYSGTEDVVFGATSSGRTAGPPGIETMVGLFINTLPVRVRVGPEESVGTYLKRLQGQQSRAQEYEYTPLMQVQGWSEAARGRPLFESILVFENYPVNASLRESERARLEIAEAKGFERTHYALALTAIPGKKLRLMLEYEPKRFERESMARRLRHLCTLLEGIAGGADCRVRDLPVLSAAEREQLLSGWNRAGTAPPAEQCIHELFVAQAGRTPRAVALVCEGAALSYAELDRRANRLARYLQKLGVGPEALVGLCVERSAEMVIGLLGILKAGGAYVPLDPAYPRERLAYMLEDARVEVLLTQGGLDSGLPAKAATVVRLDTDWEIIAQESGGRLASEATPSNLAYVIYTSGSTGRPKGVAVPHGVAAAHVETVRREFGYHESDRVLQFASYSFDVSLEQIFGPLFGGAAVVLKDKEAWGRAEFQRAARSAGLTVADVPPAYLLQLMGENGDEQVLPSTLRLVFCGGESMPAEAVRRWHQLGLRSARLVNAYGPTEAVITATCFEVPAQAGGWPATRRVPIGRPLEGRTAYILDWLGRLAPVGVAGELYLGGRYLARGYLNRPGLTAERFVPDPFSTEAGSRLYRTGDMARYLADGNLEFIGRTDEQVKVRGFRIELGEVEAALAVHPEVREAVVTASEDAHGSKRLVAYVTRVATDEGGAPAPNGQIELWPSVGEYQVYDNLLYSAMTYDELRNEKYKVVINSLVKDKVVVDIGTGKDAILARLCAEAGARRVYAVETLEPSYRSAKALVERLGLADRIEVIHGDSFGVRLPEEVDVCVWEIIGTIGSSEGAVPILNDARRFLKDGGVNIPRRCLTKVAAVELPDQMRRAPRLVGLPAAYAERVFERVGHRFDVRLCLKHYPAEILISDTGVFEDLDFTRYLNPASAEEVTLTINRDARLDGLLLWINLHLCEDIVIDALGEDYNWLPVYFPAFGLGWEVRAGDRLEAVCSATPSDNGVNPDYRVRGRLRRLGGETVEFDFHSYHHGPSYKGTEFYQRLFAEGADGAAAQTATSEKSLRDYLAERLPEYMVPTTFVDMEELPRTPNGKVDRRRLPAPERVEAESSESFAAPRSLVEELVAGIFGRVLGRERVGVHDDFFKLGGHSILAVRLMSEIQKQFGRELPLAILFEKRTVERLSEVLRRQFDALPDSPLVPIQPLGAKRPLFFVHVGSGQVLCYLELALHLGTDQPFYGLQDTNRYGEEAGGAAGDIPIAGMAARYIDALRAVQPEGPYMLGGWSFGGLVAYEMALQLTARGEEVSLLILLDTATPDFIHDLSREDDASLLAILAEEMGLTVSRDHLRPLEAEAQLRYVTEQMEKAHLLLEDSRAFLKRQLEIFKSRVRAISKYHPQPYAGRIVFFSAGEASAEADATHLMSEAAIDPTRGFGKLATGSLEVYTVPGHHHQIARGESAQILAEMLRARIEREGQPGLVLDAAP